MIWANPGKLIAAERIGVSYEVHPGASGPGLPHGQGVVAACLSSPFLCLLVLLE